MQPTDRQPGYLLKRAQNELRTAMERRMADVGLTMSRYAALAALDDHGALSNAALARKCFVTPQTMTRLVRDLDDHGLVTREPNPSSAREVLARIEPDGAAALVAGHAIAGEVQDRMLAGLDGDDRARFESLLDRVIVNLAADTARAPSAPPADATWSSIERPRFVIQEHAATARHFDVRLEVDGVLASWAVPKGPSTDPRKRRLAVHVGDHDLTHAEVEGPSGDRPGRGVIVWDTGHYRNLTTDDNGMEVGVATAIAHGHVTVWLEGHKVRGGWALTQARLGGDDDNWLLVKVADEHADARRDPVSTQPESVRTGHTLDQVVADTTPDI